MPSEYPVLYDRPIDQWKVIELKDELRRRNLPIKGLKEELVRRLAQAIFDEKASELSNEEGNSADSVGDPADNGEQEQLNSLVNTENIADSCISGDVNMVEPISNIPDANRCVLREGRVMQVSDGKADELPADRMMDNIVDSSNSEDVILNAVEPITDIPDTNQCIIGEDSRTMQVSDGMAVELPADNMTENSVDSSISKDVIVNAVEPISNIPDTNECIIGEDSRTMQVSDGKPDELPVDMLDTKCISSGGPSDLSQLKTEDAEPHIQVDKVVIEDVKCVSEDIKPSLLEPVDQVSVVSPDLEFQVKTDSISTLSESINEKNELKDNLNADDFPLEIEDNKAEMVKSLSSECTAVGDDTHSLDDSKMLVENQVPSELFIVKHKTDMGIGQKCVTVDGGSPEKLNLDRISSGDDSAEEDVVDNKQVEAQIASDDVTKKSEVLKDEPMEDVSQTVVERVLSPEKRKIDEQISGAATQKRKLEEVVGTDSESGGNSLLQKRQHRWKPEAIKTPEPKEPNHSPLTTLSDLNQPTLRRTFAKTESTISGDLVKERVVALPIKRALARSDSIVSSDSPKERVVPPPKKPATTSLKIERFLRPFTLKAVHDLLGKTGNVCSFWMDQIKTHCFVTYSSVEEATATRNAVYNLRWPANGGNLLESEFVDPQEVKARAEVPAAQATTPVSPAPITPPAPQQLPQPSPRQRLVRGQPPPTTAVPPPPPPQLPAPPLAVREQLLPPPPPLRDPEPPILTLDDLFKKTNTMPRIYYLPLTEKQVAAKTTVSPVAVQHKGGNE